MITKSADDVIAAIDELRAREPGGALAFDGDGTLWSGDVGEDFFVALLEHGLHPRAHEALVLEAEAASLSSEGTPSDIAHRIHAAYLAGSFSEERICEIMVWAAAGMTTSDVDAFARDVLRAHKLETRLHTESLRVVRHARRVGVEVFIVSASPRAVIEAASTFVDVDVRNAIAAREEYGADGTVTCDVVRPIPYGPGKVQRLRERIGERVLYAAFGDNVFDVPMLCEARVPVAVRPKQRLVARAADVASLVVLSPEANPS